MWGRRSPSKARCICASHGKLMVMRHHRPRSESRIRHQPRHNLSRCSSFGRRRGQWHLRRRLHPRRRTPRRRRFHNLKSPRSWHVVGLPPPLPARPRFLSGRRIWLAHQYRHLCLSHLVVGSSMAVVSSMVAASNMAVGSSMAAGSNMVVVSNMVAGSRMVVGSVWVVSARHLAGHRCQVKRHSNHL